MKGWRTIAFGALIAFLGGIQAADLAQIIPAEYADLAMVVIGGVVMWLRKVTNTPVGVAAPAPVAKK